LSVTLTNTGIAPLALGGSTTQGDFSEADNCGTAVAVGANCTLTVKFTPTALGHRTGTLTIPYSGGGSQTVSLAGDGGPVGLILTPPVIDFGVQPKGATSTAHTATLSNNTGQSIPDLAIVASGEYSETDNCGTSLANSATCTLNITVTPATTGAITGTVAISGAGVFATTVPSVKTRGESVGDAAAAPSISNVGVVATLADTNGNVNATASELAFVSPPPPVIPAGGNAGSFITVLETDSNGNPVSATDAITLIVTGPSGYTKTYTATASGGIATFNLSGNALTAAGNYTYTVSVASNASIKSATVSETVIDFSLNPGNVNGEGPSQTLIPGGTATYALVIVPTSGTTLPASTTLTVSGMPAGATVSLPISSWTQLTGNSWSFPANTTFTGFALTIQVPSATARLDNKDAPARKIPPVLWGILLLPFVGSMRRIGKRLGRTASILTLVVVGLTAAVALSGCGTSNGFFGQAQKTYTVTVTATSGTLSHSTNLTLTVE
jgi:hypothetical protein